MVCLHVQENPKPTGVEIHCVLIPPDGIGEGKSIYDYSHSINWLEHQIGYNLYPKLPVYLQEIIEEMTAMELLCPFQEFDPAMNERPEQEIDYDWEADSRDP